MKALNLLPVQTVDNGCGELGPCINWQGAVNSKGYPSASNGRGGSDLVHRMVWADVCGPIPPGHHIHHACGNRRCIRIGHLEMLTPAEHNRHHTEDPLAPRLLEILADGEPRHSRELAALVGKPQASADMTLRRCVKLGEVERVAPSTWRIPCP